MYLPCCANHAEGRLEVVNLGDSGVRVIREGVVAFASAAQQHMFNMPFQLSHPSIIESPDDADSASTSIVDVQVRMRVCAGGWGCVVHACASACIVCLCWDAGAPWLPPEFLSRPAFLEVQTRSPTAGGVACAPTAGWCGVKLYALVRVSP